MHSGHCETYLRRHLLKLKGGTSAMSYAIPRALALLLISAGLTMCQTKGVLLEDLTWIEAEAVLKPDTVVVIPIGAESKEHGPHLRLKNDFLMAEYLKRRVLASAPVVVAPTVNYH